jgi:hypothetical protein
MYALRVDREEETERAGKVVQTRRYSLATSVSLDPISAGRQLTSAVLQ